MKKRANAKSPMKDSVSHPKQLSHMSDNGRGDIIARTAYDLYEQRGREEGHALEDWLKAEAIVTGMTN